MSARPHCLLLLLPLIAALGQEPAAFRSEVNLVNVTTIVRSSAGSVLPNLTRTDFDILEDGVPQSIQYFAHETELPLSIGLIVDVSGSQDKFLRQHTSDVEAFLKTVLRPTDQAFAVCFGNHLRLVSDTGTDADAILQGLRSFQKGSRDFPEVGPREDRDLGTALYDAIYFSLTQKLQTSGQRRRALIVFTDGEDNSSEHDLLDVIEAAQNTDTVVYCVRYTEMKHGKLNARNRYGIRVLKHISGLSGASDFDGVTADLPSVFSQISQELRSMYQISYVSSNANPHDGSFRKVAVHCRQPGTATRTKTGYYAR